MQWLRWGMSMENSLLKTRKLNLSGFRNLTGFFENIILLSLKTLEKLTLSSNLNHAL